MSYEVLIIELLITNKGFSKKIREKPLKRKI